MTTKVGTQASVQDRLESSNPRSPTRAGDTASFLRRSTKPDVAKTPPPPTRRNIGEFTIDWRWPAKATKHDARPPHMEHGMPEISERSLSVC